MMTKKAHRYNKLLGIVFIMLLVLTFCTWAHAEVPIEILSSDYWAADILDTVKVKNAAREALQLSDTEHLKAKIKAIYSDFAFPDHLIVYLLSKKTYYYETARVNLDADYQLLSVERDYVEEEADLAQDPTEELYGTCPDNSVQMVFATCETGIPTAVAAINYAAQVAQNDGYNVKVLLGSQENRSAYDNWLACDNLMLIGRVGHGSTTGIMVADGTVSYSYFNGLPSNALSDKVLIFNSCQVYNNPLLSAILGRGVQRFAGGITDLMIGPSEQAFRCWMDRVITNNQAMTPSLQYCEDGGQWGISGTGSDYLSDDPSPPPPDPPTPGDDVLDNGETVSNLSAGQGEWIYYKINVPSGASDLQIEISGGTGDADLYTRFGSQPTTSSYDCRPYINGNNETCTEESPSSGTWYIGIRAYSAFSGLTLTASYEGESPPPPEPPDPGDNVLENGEEVNNLSAGQGEWIYYKIDVPSGASDLQIEISGGTGDADLYTRFDSQPTTSSYDCRPYINGNDETCPEASPSAGTWHIGIRGYRAFSGVSLTGSYVGEEPPGPGPTPGDDILDDGETVINLSAGQGEWIYYRINVPVGADYLNISIWGGTGDADLYVRNGSKPTLTSYNCRPYKSGNYETCATSPLGGEYYIGIRAYYSFSGVSLRGYYY